MSANVQFNHSHFVSQKSGAIIAKDELIRAELLNFKAIKIESLIAIMDLSYALYLRCAV